MSLAQYSVISSIKPQVDGLNSQMPVVSQFRQAEIFDNFMHVNVVGLFQTIVENI